MNINPFSLYDNNDAIQEEDSSRFSDEETYSQQSQHSTSSQSSMVKLDVIICSVLVPYLSKYAEELNFSDKYLKIVIAQVEKEFRVKKWNLSDDLSKRADKLIPKGNRLGSCWKTVLLDELNNLIEGPEALEAWKKRITSIKQQSVLPQAIKKRKVSSNSSTFIQQSADTHNTFPSVENTITTSSDSLNIATSQSRQHGIQPIITSSISNRDNSSRVLSSLLIEEKQGKFYTILENLKVALDYRGIDREERIVTLHHQLLECMLRKVQKIKDGKVLLSSSKFQVFEILREHKLDGDGLGNE